jgi:hypothetical protein
MEGVRTWVKASRLCETGFWSVDEDPSGVTGTPAGFARGVAAPSISSGAELFTGRKEVMLERRE